MTFQVLLDHLKTLVVDAMFDAKNAHRLIFSDEDPYNRNLSSALAYIGTMTSKYCAAYSIYVSNFDTLEDSDIERLLHSFKVYANEYLQSYSTNHSFQWVDIDYTKLVENFERSPFSDGVEIKFN